MKGGNIKEAELKSFMEIYEDHIIDFIDEEVDIDEMSKEIFESETNWYNADRTSGHCIRSEEEISSMLEDVPRMMHKVFDDRCDKCGALITDDDKETQNEPRGEFWGSPCSETIVIGHTCSKCGDYVRY